MESSAAFEPAAAAGVGHPGRQPLVVGLDRDVDELLELGGEIARGLRLLALGAVERDGQADQDGSALALGDQPATTAGSGGEITSIGVTIVPVGSQTAAPQRTAP